MVATTMKLNCSDKEPVWPDIDPANVHMLGNNAFVRLAHLPAALASGLPGLAMRIGPPIDGKEIMLITSARHIAMHIGNMILNDPKLAEALPFEVVPKPDAQRT